MKDSLEKLGAIFKVAQALATIDGEPEKVTLEPMSDFFYGACGLNEEEVNRVADCANNDFSIQEATKFISKLDDEIKQKVVNLLYEIIHADGQVTENEKKVFALMILLCGLPDPVEEQDPNDVCPPTFIVVQPNGMARAFRADDEDWRSLDAEISTHIGAERTEVVRYTAPLNALSKSLQLRDCHLVFLVDREFASKQEIGDNMTGTMLYGSGHEILGNIVFALETDSGYKLKGIRSMVQLGNLYNAINEAVGGLLKLQ